MLYREILITVCSKSRKIISTGTLCGQNMEYLNIKPGGTYSNHWHLTANRAYGASHFSTSDNLSAVFVCVFIYI